jgi:hypothetical protein
MFFVHFANYSPKIKYLTETVNYFIAELTQCYNTVLRRHKTLMRATGSEPVRNTVSYTDVQTVHTYSKAQLSAQSYAN